MLTLTRPINCTIAAVSVLVGAYIAQAEIRHFSMGLAMVSLWCLCGGANTLNDVCDIDIDRHNKPHRPLVSGAVTEQTAVILTTGLYLAGVGLSLLLSIEHSIVAVILIGLTVLYNLFLKRRLLSGNIVAGCAASLAFVYGGLLGPDVMYALIPTGFAFLFHFGREILKDMEDISGDRAGKVESAPIKYGDSAARFIITTTFILLIATTLWPYIAGWFGQRYLVMVAIVDLVLVYVLWSMWRDVSPDNAGRLSRVLKANMVLGLIAVVLGR